MPKLKTHKATQKRIKISATGKLLRQKAYKGHFLSKKSAATKRAFRQDQNLAGSNRKAIRRNLGV